MVAEWENTVGQIKFLELPGDAGGKKNLIAVCFIISALLRKDRRQALLKAQN